MLMVARGESSPQLWVGAAQAGNTLFWECNVYVGQEGAVPMPQESRLDVFRGQQQSSS